MPFLQTSQIRYDTLTLSVRCMDLVAILVAVKLHAQTVEERTMMIIAVRMILNASTAKETTYIDPNGSPMGFSMRKLYP